MYSHTLVHTHVQLQIHISYTHSTRTHVNVLTHALAYTHMYLVHSVHYKLV